MSFVASHTRSTIIGILVIVAFCSAVIATEPSLEIPVEGATKRDWHPDSFWYEPWGASIVHRGIDIFARPGTRVIAPTSMMIGRIGENSVSGKYVVGIDRALRLHFFAHLNSIDTDAVSVLRTGEPIGTVGDTGNARNKPPHLHYGLASIIPRPLNMTLERLGYLRAFYLNPDDHFQ